MGTNTVKLFELIPREKQTVFSGFLNDTGL